MHPVKTPMFLAFLLIILFAISSQATQHPLYPNFAQPISSFLISKNSITFPTEQSTDSITMNITDDAIYRHVKTSFDGQDWADRTIQDSTQCTFHPDDPSHDWLTGTCTLTIPMAASDFPSLLPGTTAVRNYITAYSCDEVLFPFLPFRIGWDCHGSTAEPQMWQIHQFDASLDAQEPPPSWQDGLVSWWKLDGNANDSVGDNDGTVNGAAPTNTGCISGGCYSFDGVNDYIDFGNDASLNIVNDITVSFWIRPDSLDGTPIPFSRGAYNINGWYTMLRTSGYISTRLCTPGTDNDLNSNPGLSNGEWTHVVIVISNGNSYDYYFDGTLDKHSTTSFTYSGSTSQNFYIGAYNAGGQDPFDGMIDEAMIWNRALSASEVAAVYNYFTRGCETDGDCPPDGTEYYCSGGDAYRDEHDWSCSAGLCTESVTAVLVDDCGTGEICVGGACVACMPSCTGKECGPNNCGGSCGDCSEYGSGYTCVNGQCTEDAGDIFDIYFSQDFEDDTLGTYNYNEYKEDWNYPSWENFQVPPLIVQNTDPEHGTKVMRYIFPEGCVSPSEGGGQWITLLDEPHDEVYFSYRIKFKPGFEWVLGGKIPGLRAGPSWPGFGPPPWDNGFVGLLMWKPNHIVFYYYHHDQVGDYGDTEYWDPIIESGEWYTITIRVVMSTVDEEGGNNDGILEGFLNGELARQITGLRLRNLESVGVDRLYVTSFFGGDTEDWASTRDEWIEVDDFYVFTYKDSVEGIPRLNEPSSPGRVLELPS